MAMNADSKKSMAAGLFGGIDKNKEREQKKQPAAELIEAPETKKRPLKKTGRPRDNDLQENEAVVPTTVQLTEETQFLVDSYALNHKGMSRSQIIRELIRKYIKDL